MTSPSEKPDSTSLEWVKTALTQNLKLRDGFSQNEGAHIGVSAEIYDISKPFDNPSTNYHRPRARLEVPLVIPQALYRHVGDAKFADLLLHQAAFALQKEVLRELSQIADEEAQDYIASLDGKAFPRDIGFHTDRVCERIQQRAEQVVTTDLVDRVAVKVALAQLYYEMVRRQQYTPEGRDAKDRFYTSMLRIGDDLFGLYRDPHYKKHEHDSDGLKADALGSELYHFSIALRTIREFAAEKDAIRLGDLSLAGKPQEGIWPEGLRDWQSSSIVLHEMLIDLAEHDPGLLNSMKPRDYEEWDWPPKEHVADDVLEKLKAAAPQPA